MKFLRKLFIPRVLIFISLLGIILFCFITPDLSVISFPFNLVGLAIAFPGFVIMGKAHDLFKKYNTTLGFEDSSFMIEEGIFGKSRNPMYLEMFLLLLGISICFANLIFLIIPFVFILIIRIYFIPIEEKLMKNTFGEKYLNYKKKTRMWI